MKWSFHSEKGKFTREVAGKQKVIFTMSSAFWVVKELNEYYWHTYMFSTFGEETQRL